MNDDEMRDRLRRADPATSLPPADAGATARRLEVTMSHDPDSPPVDETRATGTRHRSNLTWLVAAAAVVLIAAVGVFGLMNRDTDDAGPVVDGGPAAGAPSDTEPASTLTQLSVDGATEGRCMVPNAELLRSQSLAFDGTVESLTDGVATLAPTEFFAGDPTDLVAVAAPGEELQALLGAVDFREGERYLVSATDGRVTLCGFTAPYSSQLASLYAEAFGE